MITYFKPLLTITYLIILVDLAPLSFAQQPTNLSNTPIQGVGTFGQVNPNQTLTIFDRFASTIIGFLTVLGGLAFGLYFILGAIAWITSSGDTQKVDAAKGQMTSAGIGLVVIVSSYIIIGVVGTVLGLDILNPMRYFR